MQIQNMMSYFRKGRAKRIAALNLLCQDFVSAIMQDFLNLACCFFHPRNRFLYHLYAVFYPSHVLFFELRIPFFTTTFDHR